MSGRLDRSPSMLDFFFVVIFSAGASVSSLVLSIVDSSSVFVSVGVAVEVEVRLGALLDASAFFPFFFFFVAGTSDDSPFAPLSDFFFFFFFFFVVSVVSVLSIVFGESVAREEPEEEADADAEEDEEDAETEEADLEPALSFSGLYFFHEASLSYYDDKR
eukprot:TRINITY_DN1408_c0_g3_i1.p1 TRINITY_DN1408_c0_g3~~TRINITY_DN1408_c0_g3_i1.p1  ORF type:complete len:161 (-),score=40.77 TRINITY_DN1408_c0_g3_i1:559-1041(-)